MDDDERRDEEITVLELLRALIAEGFSPKEAVELVIETELIPPDPPGVA